MCYSPVLNTICGDNIFSNIYILYVFSNKDNAQGDATGESILKPKREARNSVPICAGQPQSAH